MVTTGLAMTLCAASSGARPRQASTPPGEPAYNRVCRVCHGAEGRGDAAPRLVPFERSAEELLGIVRDGRGDMPPQSARTISDDEVTAVVAYLTSLRGTSRGAP
jgi:mono/diheme cytochrome c family protein